MQTNDTWKQYMKYRADIYETLLPANCTNSLISEANWVVRCRMQSCEAMGMTVRPGDICYMDFGQAYLNEAGYQHFGLVMAIMSKKALVVPMTSNPATYAKAYDENDNPEGKKHLMRIGQIRGMRKPSVLFLNDMKFINTARVIEIRSHISTRSAMFRQAQKRMKEIIFPKG